MRDGQSDDVAWWRADESGCFLHAAARSVLCVVSCFAVRGISDTQRVLYRMHTECMSVVFSQPSHVSTGAVSIKHALLITRGSLELGGVVPWAVTQYSYMNMS